MFDEAMEGMEVGLSMFYRKMRGCGISEGERLWGTVKKCTF